jgi:hypothetical protein
MASETISSISEACTQRGSCREIQPRSLESSKLDFGHPGSLESNTEFRNSSLRVDPGLIRPLRDTGGNSEFGTITISLTSVATTVDTD